MKPKCISKVLSSNDTGETGGHQAGILIPKGGEILEFFPDLNDEEQNPRTCLYFIDDTNQRWKFNFIYYNNKFFGGTRNEYRLTGMTAYIRQNNLRTGDTVILSRDDNGILSIRCERHKTTVSSSPRLVLTGTWKVIGY